MKTLGSWSLMATSNEPLFKQMLAQVKENLHPGEVVLMIGDFGGMFSSECIAITDQRILTLRQKAMFLENRFVYKVEYAEKLGALSSVAYDQDKQTLMVTADFNNNVTVEKLRPEVAEFVINWWSSKNQIDAHESTGEVSHRNISASDKKKLEAIATLHTDGLLDFAQYDRLTSEILDKYSQDQ